MMDTDSNSKNDLAAQYIALLEARMHVADKLAEAYADLRSITEQTEAVNAEVNTLAQESLLLKSQLESHNSAIAKCQLLSEANEKLQMELTDLRARGATAVVTHGGQRSTNLVSQNHHNGSETSSTHRDTVDQSITDKRGLKRLQPHESISSEAATAPSMHADGHFLHTHSRSTVSNSSFASDSAVSADVQLHVLTSEDGEVKCRYCLGPFTSPHQNDWIQHIASCESTPKAVTNSLSSADAYSLLEGGADVVGAEKLSASIDDHVTKKGIGRNRIVSCNYCSAPIKSDSKKEWEKHMYAKCPSVPSAVREIYLPFSEPTQMNWTPQSHNYDAHPLKQSAEGSSPSLTTADQSYGDHSPLYFPTEPVPYLPDGTPNTLRFRAWMDIIRYQRPRHKIVNASGLKMTSFKKMNQFPEVRLIAETSSSKSTLGCYAVPEYLQQAFLDHFDGDNKTGRPSKGDGRRGPRGHLQELTPSTVFTKSDSFDGQNSGLRRNSSVEGSIFKAAAYRGSGSGKKYISVIREIMPSFPMLPDDSRKAVKRGVRLFLEAELQDKFADYVIVKGGGTMYMIPDDLMDAFKEWAYEELTRCFPDELIVRV
ncbi:hypothetical protein HDU80_009261 [Chytriomyces hyalinus]|nr:hypothetical protein HDU80_009261 [Chytriomyces hyalinus]